MGELSGEDTDIFVELYLSFLTVRIQHRFFSSSLHKNASSFLESLREAGGKTKQAVCEAAFMGRALPGDFFWK